MPLESHTFGRYSVVCDDPYHRGCKEEIGPYFGEERVGRKAIDEGWFKSAETGNYACPHCMRHHRVRVAERIHDEEMNYEESHDSGDPFTAAFVAALLGGDPMTAAGVTMMTDSTMFGVLAGVAAGDGERPAEAVLEDRQVEPEQPMRAEEESVPVIVDPFVEERATESVEADTPESSVSDEGPEATSFDEGSSGGGDTADSSSTSY